jgi:hypothetical protein
MFTSNTIPVLKRAITSVTTIARTQKTRPACSRASSVQTVNHPPTPYATPCPTPTQPSIELSGFPFPPVQHPQMEGLARPPAVSLISRLSSMLIGYTPFQARRRTTFQLPMSPREHAVPRDIPEGGPGRGYAATRFSTEAPSAIDQETEALGLGPFSPFRPTREHQLTPYPREEAAKDSYF